MTLFESTVKTLNAAAFVYLLAAISHFFAISTAGGRALGKWARLGAWLVNIGFVLHTYGLIGRWIIGGIHRPPWTNLYESLIFFAWGVVLFQVIAQQKWRLPVVGAFSMPLVFVLMGMAVMTPNKLVEPLIPALQSYWLKIHVIFGMIAYAGFTMAACFGFLHLLKNRNSLSKIGASMAFVTVFNMGVAGGYELFETGKFYMARTVVRTLDDGSKVEVKDSYREFEGGPVITRMEEVPHAHFPFWAAAALFLIAAFCWIFRRGQHKGNDLEGWGRAFFCAAIASLIVFFGVVLWGIKTHESLSLASNPYLILLLMMMFFFVSLFVVVSSRYEAFLTALPSHERLDELGYKNILFAFPFQTLLLITGAIWAYSAWGRSWGWDPKETWALITWIVYLIYLHGKLLMNWRPWVLSTLALIGFVVMVFAFLGVNLVLSGLHSYGAA